MNLLSITVGSQKYMSSKLTMSLTREAMKINRDALALAEKIKDVDPTAMDLDSSLGMLKELEDQMDRKVLLICRVYGDKFSVSDLESEFTQAEVDQEINRIIQAASGVISKN